MRALGRELREVVLARRGIPFLLLPGPLPEERALEIGDDRPFDARLQVAPRTLVEGQVRVVVLPADRDRGRAVDAADVDASQECHAAIDERELAMVAMVERVEPSRHHGSGPQRIELDHLHAARGEVREEFPGRVERARRVVDEPHVESRPRFLGQRGGELPADVIAVEDVGLHVDVVLRPLDGGKHRRVGLGAVFEERHLVADAERSVGQRLLDREVMLEDVVAGGVALDLLEERLALRAGEYAARALEAHFGDVGFGPQEIAVERRGRARAEKRSEERECRGPEAPP